MKIVIIGDSNLCQHVFKDEGTATKSLGGQVSFKRTSMIQTFKETLNTLDKPNIVIISTLLNQIIALESLSGWTGEIDEAKTLEINSVIVGMTTCINKFTEDNKDIKIIIVPPILRLHPLWLSENLDEIESCYRNGMANGILYLDAPPIEINDLGKDGIHIKQSGSAKIKLYLKNAINQVLQDSTTESRKRLRENDEQDLAGLSTKELLLRIHAQGEEMKILIDRTKQCEEKTEVVVKSQERFEQKLNGNLVHQARMSETLDGHSNAKKMNILVIRNI